MTANRVYLPALIGGKIEGVQITIQNKSGSSVSCLSTNGVYYSFEGKDYQLLSLDGVTVAAGETKIKTEDKVLPWIPNADIKLMVDTAGMVDCGVKFQISWGV